MIQMIYKGMRRRRAETRYVSLVTFIAVLFMTGVTLFQNIMNEYVFSTNLHNYGDWIISSVDKTCKHPYLLTESKLTTGTYLVDEDGDSLQLYAGKMDENFGETYEEILYEGRMPEKEGEIAMDISALAILGYSYDVGQTVELSYLDGEEIQTRQFHLVGTLKNFSAIWKSERMFPLPNFIVTESDFSEFDAGAFQTYFYQLNPEYNEINTSEFVMHFVQEDAGGTENPVVYNDYVYENKLWGSAEMFGNVTSAIMLIGTLAIGYLLIAYTGKRRETYYRCRSIGASKMQIRGIVCFECLLATIPQLAAGLFGAYGSAYLACKIAQANQLAVHYIFDGTLLGKQIVSAGLVIVLSVFAAQCSISDKRIAGNTGKIKPSKYRALRRAAKRTKCPEKKLFQRQQILHPMQRVISSVFSILVCSCLFLCIFKIYSRYDYNMNRILDRTKDFVMNYEDVEKYSYDYNFGGISGTEFFAPDDLSMGVDEQFLEAVKTSPGIKSIELYWTDGAHVFEWEGMNESQVMIWLKLKQEYHTPLEYGMEMVFYEDIDAMKQAFTEEELLQLETEQKIDWEAVAKGEQVIMNVGLVYSEIIWEEDDFEEEIYYFEEKTLHQGDALDIVHFKDGTRTAVKVGGMIFNGEYLDESYQLIGTRALAEKIVKAEGRTLKYNNMEIMYDTHASYESTDKQLAALAVNNGMDYYSGAETRRIAIQEMLQDAGIYGVLFVVILIVYVILQRSFLTSRLKFMEEKYWTLKRIGMSNGQYMQTAVWAEVKGHLWILAGFVTGYLLIFWEQCIWNKAMGTAEEYIVETAARTVQYLPHAGFIGFILFIYVFMIAMSAICVKHIVERGEQR